MSVCHKGTLQIEYTIAMPLVVWYLSKYSIILHILYNLCYFSSRQTCGGVSMMVACYKANYLSVGVRIWFRVNYGSRVFGVRVNFSSEIGLKWPKKGQKRVKNFLGASHMINNNIFNIFSFSTFSLGYFLDPALKAIFLKFSQNAGFVKYPREKVGNLKMLKMLLFIICEAPQKNLTLFWPFFAIFTLFHLTNLL